MCPKETCLKLNTDNKIIKQKILVERGYSAFLNQIQNPILITWQNTQKNNFPIQKQNIWALKNVLEKADQKVALCTDPITVKKESWA